MSKVVRNMLLKLTHTFSRVDS